MQRFPCSDLKYEYSARHEPIGRVAAGERFQVETEDGFSGRFRRPDAFTPENVEWVARHMNAVTGPVYVEGAEPGQAVAVAIEEIQVTTPGSVVVSRYSDPSPEDWWLEEIGCRSYAIADGHVLFGDRRIPVRPLIGCLAAAPAAEVVLSKREGSYGGNIDCNEVTSGATVVLPVEVEGASLYFGDCKAAMGDGEIVQPPEVGTVITASAEPRPRPKGMRWPRVEAPGFVMTVVSARTLEEACRTAFAELLAWVEEDHGLAREEAALLMGMVAHVGVCQISNTLATGKCSLSRAYLDGHAG